MITKAALCGVKSWSVLGSRMVGKDVIGISFGSEVLWSRSVGCGRGDESRVAGADPGQTDDRTLGSCEGEVRNAAGLGVEAACRQWLDRRVGNLAAVTEVPGAGDHRGEAVVAVGVRCDRGVRRHVNFEHIRAGLGGVARE